MPHKGSYFKQNPKSVWTCYFLQCLFCNRTSLNFETFCLFWGDVAYKGGTVLGRIVIKRGVKVHSSLDRLNFYYYINVFKRFSSYIVKIGSSFRNYSEYLFGFVQNM
jgi:hypothetical protein